MKADKKRLLWVILFLLLFGSGIAGGYFFVSTKFFASKAEPHIPQSVLQPDNDVFVRIFYPSDSALVMEERRVRRATEITMAEEIVAEFLKGPLNRAASVIPSGAKVLGLYQGNDGILYVDLSDEFRRNFQGDALAEFLLLKGLYESIISNVKGVNDVKVIIEGKEIESIGGHLFALYPLKNTVAEAK
ncbi:MAG: GerMN domain-containing protein [Thermodesulfovibrionales bacterium]|jgi:spore germination protein GerM